MDQTPGCSVEGCTDRHFARGMCRRHYYQAKRGGQPTLERGGDQYTDETTACEADGCSEVFRQRARGGRRKYCSRRCRDRILKRQQRATGWVPSHKRDSQPRCAVEGCEKPKFSLDVCQMHYQRVKTHGEPGSADSKRRPGEWRVSAEGYLYRFADGAKQLQHRVVLEQALGRALLPHETVHHKNGDRADNRIENLELWSSWQPAGQRAADKLAWAREIIAQYGDLPPEAM
jgi:hypothetical protein